MKVLLLAFDPARAAAAAGHTRAQLADGDELVVVSTAPIDGERVYIPPSLPGGYSPDESLSMGARLARTACLYRENHAAWRALRRDAGFVALVRWADLVVIGDELSVRTAWNAARRSSTPVWGRISTIGYARTAVVREGA